MIETMTTKDMQRALAIFTNIHLQIGPDAWCGVKSDHISDTPPCCKPHGGVRR